jgi:hypothetical protein
VERWRIDWASLAVLVIGLFVACVDRAGPAAKPGEDETAQAQSASAVARLDAELERGWAEAGIEPGPRASDAEYLRRVSLDLLGRVPSRDELARFLADEAPDKRARLVDELLEREEFASYWGRLWADRLLPGDRRARRLAGDALEGYFGEALARGRSWDRVTHDLLAGEGDLDEHPQLAFLGARPLRGNNKQDTLAELGSTTANVFLGARIECAQCHDHPYQPDFSREDFWAQTAFFGRTTVALEREDGAVKIEVGERSRGELRVALGGDDDPRKRPIPPRFMGAEASISDSSSSPRRTQLAAAIVADPRFAEASVGWVWTQLFGRGIVEPWDDLLAAGERPPLLELLAAEFRAGGYDMRALLRTIVLSQAYQRSSAGPVESPRALAAAEAAFARAPVRPLSAEQLFASVLTVTGLEQVAGRGFRRAVRRRKQAALREYEFVFADEEMAAAEGFSGNIPQALLLLNGALTNQGVVARPGGSLDRILTEHEDVDARLEELWLTVYGRAPSPAQLELGREAVAGGREADWEDLMFAMLYSSEFTTNH